MIDNAPIQETKALAALVEPWKCCACEKLIHNTRWEDGKCYPAPGAPEAHFHSAEYPRICQMCLGMLIEIAASDYMRQVQREEEAKVARLKQNS